ncbi:hypothetical protein Bbelb_343350 [Branchiostoma belcheri]|nr:hypothetical protein Bbelb_343350 [Branchiostoma belcheri]
MAIFVKKSRGVTVRELDFSKEGFQEGLFLDWTFSDNNHIDAWTRSLQEGKPVNVIYLDFEKAFDTVPLKRLISKMERYGVGGKLRDWIEDFLSNREQRVVHILGVSARDLARKRGFRGGKWHRHSALAYQCSKAIHHWMASVAVPSAEKGTRYVGTFAVVDYESVKKQVFGAGSITESTLPAASKAFHRQGSDRVGQADLFEAYLTATSSETSDGASSSKSWKGSQVLAQSSMFLKEVGNRVNCTVKNALAFFLHQEDMKGFLGTWNSSLENNGLLKALEKYVSSPTLLAAVRTLGIVYCKLCGPFEMAYSMVKNIFDMNQHILTFQPAIREYKHDGRALLQSGPGSLLNVNFRDITEEHQQKLFKENQDLDEYTAMRLELLLQHWEPVVERQAGEYLPGGKYADFSEDDRKQAQTVPVTQVRNERAMAVIDREKKIRPNATPGYIESKMMTKDNNVKGILESVEEEEAEKLFAFSRQEGRRLNKKDKESYKT